VQYFQLPVFVVAVLGHMQRGLNAYRVKFLTEKLVVT
jgi:hypothetical protein